MRPTGRRQVLRTELAAGACRSLKSSPKPVVCPLGFRDHIANSVIERQHFQMVSGRLADERKSIPASSAAKGRSGSAENIPEMLRMRNHVALGAIGPIQARFVTNPLHRFEIADLLQAHLQIETLQARSGSRIISERSRNQRGRKHRKSNYPRRPIYAIASTFETKSRLHRPVSSLFSDRSVAKAATVRSIYPDRLPPG
jgi:hypothetical protein